MEYSWLCEYSKLIKLFYWPCILFSTEKSAWDSDGVGDTDNLRTRFDSLTVLQLPYSLRTVVDSLAFARTQACGYYQKFARFVFQIFTHNA